MQIRWIVSVKATVADQTKGAHAVVEMALATEAMSYPEAVVQAVVSHDVVEQDGRDLRLTARLVGAAGLPLWSGSVRRCRCGAI